MKKTVRFFLLTTASTLFFVSLSFSTAQAIIRPERASRQAQLKQKRLNRRETIMEQKARIQEIKASKSAQIKLKKQNFEARIKELKNERKQKILQSLLARYKNINERWTNHFLHVLNRLSLILDKLELRAQKAAEKDIDTSRVNDAIALARQTIKNAQTEVEQQGANQYIIEINDEASLRQEAKKVNQNLRADLSSLRKLTRQAREAVHKVFQTLKEAIAAHNQANQPTITINDLNNE